MDELATALAEVESLKTTVRILAHRLQNQEDLADLLRLCVKQVPSKATQEQMFELLRRING